MPEWVIKMNKSRSPSFARMPKNMAHDFMAEDHEKEGALKSLSAFKDALDTSMADIKNEGLLSFLSSFKTEMQDALKTGVADLQNGGQERRVEVLL